MKNILYGLLCAMVASNQLVAMQGVHPKFFAGDYTKVRTLDFYEFDAFDTCSFDTSGRYMHFVASKCAEAGWWEKGTKLPYCIDLQSDYTIKQQDCQAQLYDGSQVHNDGDMMVCIEKGWNTDDVVIYSIGATHKKIVAIGSHSSNYAQVYLHNDKTRIFVLRHTGGSSGSGRSSSSTRRVAHMDIYALPEDIIKQFGKKPE